MADVDNRPPCALPTDRPLTIGDLLRIPPNCRIDVPDGTSFIGSTEIKDKHGHTLEGDFDPLGHRGCNHKDTPEWRAEHPRIRRKDASKAEWPSDVADAGVVEKEPAMSDTAHNEAPVAEAPKAVESIGVDAAVSQVKSLVPADASPALMIGGAAVLAIVGGALKFGPSVLKARAEARERDHEARMKELELRERESEKKEDDHGNCAAERATLGTKVQVVEAKVDDLSKKVDDVGRKVEKAVSSAPQFDEDFDPEAIEDRLARLEKAAKSKKAAKPAPRKR
jgi:hypothetical protein